MSRRVRDWELPAAGMTTKELLHREALESDGHDHRGAPGARPRTTGRLEDSMPAAGVRTQVMSLKSTREGTARPRIQATNESSYDLLRQPIIVMEGSGSPPASGGGAAAVRAQRAAHAGHGAPSLAVTAGAPTPLMEAYRQSHPPGRSAGVKGSHPLTHHAARKVGGTAKIKRGRSGIKGKPFSWTKEVTTPSQAKSTQRPKSSAGIRPFYRDPSHTQEVRGKFRHAVHMATNATAAFQPGRGAAIEGLGVFGDCVSPLSSKGVRSPTSSFSRSRGVQPERRLQTAGSGHGDSSRSLVRRDVSGAVPFASSASDFRGRTLAAPGGAAATTVLEERPYTSYSRTSRSTMRTAPSDTGSVASRGTTSSERRLQQFSGPTGVPAIKSKLGRRAEPTGFWQGAGTSLMSVAGRSVFSEPGTEVMPGSAGGGMMVVLAGMEGVHPDDVADDTGRPVSRQTRGRYPADQARPQDVGYGAYGVPPDELRPSVVDLSEPTPDRPHLTPLSDAHLARHGHAALKTATASVHIPTPARLGSSRDSSRGGAHDRMSIEMRHILRKISDTIYSSPSGVHGAYKRMHDRGEVTAHALYHELRRQGCSDLTEDEVAQAVRAFDYDGDAHMGNAEFVHMLTAASKMI